MTDASDRMREAILAGLKSFEMDQPDFCMSSAMRTNAADHILAQQGVWSPPDAGEVRTYREGVEDSARVCAEWSTMLSMRVDDLIRIRAPQRTVKAVREAANQVVNVEAAIRKLP